MHRIPAWDAVDVADLFAVDEVGPLQFRTRLGDPNENGRAYGGQVLAQALTAGARTAPHGRVATAMQFMFLQGTRYDEALDIQVTVLQEGKRFSSRHLRGSQGGERMCFDAQLSFAAPVPAPAHSVAPRVPLPDPEDLPTAADLPPHWSQAVRDAVGYGLGVREVIDFRLDAPPERLALDATEPCLRFWLRLKAPLADDPHLHAAAFAYLSDWWTNYPAVGAHQREATEVGGMYVASLNHCIWLHAPLRADDWLHFESISPAAGGGRGFSVARVHDRRGQLVASVTQECTMGLRSR